MTEFIKQNWIALSSLLIALFGGAPGIIVIIKYFRQKSAFKFSLAGIIFGDFSPNKSCMLLFSGVISNAGDKTLVPATFDLEVKIGKTWHKMQKMLIPQDSKFISNEQRIMIDKPWENDLQKIKVAITQSTPAYGFLMFTNNALKKEAFKDTKIVYKLTCTDIFEKKYTAKFSKIEINIRKGLAFPKLGMTVQPKNNDSD
jgi:hypothetical protein